MEETDRYKTIKNSSEGLYKEKGSKFIARAFHVTDEEEAKRYITQMKKEYHDARHHCYAYRLNPEEPFANSSDDGEPSGTAGKPILNQILSGELYDVLVVVIRYFGGTKLGVSGLIKAFKAAANVALSAAEVDYLTITRSLQLDFDYLLMNDVMRIIKEEKLRVIHQDFSLDCHMELEVERGRKDKLLQRFSHIFGLTVS